MYDRALLITAFAVVTLAACADAVSPTENTIDGLRDATRSYQQVNAALAAGYSPTGPCVTHPTMGAMGFHYTKQGIVDGTVNPREPEILLYAPVANGGRELIGVEFLVSSAAWDAANATPPSLAGQTFDDHRAPEARHGTPFPHYDLHVWLWRANPNGMFASFNPSVSCG